MIGWLKIALALVAELASLLLLDGPLQVAGQPLDNLAAYFALHGLAAAVSAWLAWALLPPQYRAPARPAYALLYCFAFFIPVLGVLATVLAVQIAQRYPKILRTERFVAVHMPEFSEVQREATERSDLRAGDARRISERPVAAAGNTPARAGGAAVHAAQGGGAAAAKPAGRPV
jgi:hypothetical protein